MVKEKSKSCLDICDYKYAYVCGNTITLSNNKISYRPFYEDCIENPIIEIREKILCLTGNKIIDVSKYGIINEKYNDDEIVINYKTVKFLFWKYKTMKTWHELKERKPVKLIKSKFEIVIEGKENV